MSSIDEAFTMPLTGKHLKSVSNVKYFPLKGSIDTKAYYTQKPFENVIPTQLTQYKNGHYTSQ